MNMFNLSDYKAFTRDTFLPALTHYFGLEDTSKTQIATFERLYEDSYQTEVGMPIMSFGFNDIDYSPLINPLGAVIEMELSESVYRALYPHLKQKLMQMQGNINNPVKLPSPSESTIGNLLFFLTDKRFDCSQRLHQYGISDEQTFIRLISSIKEYRNDSAHRVTMTKDQFLGFYKDFHRFYESYISKLISLKLSSDKSFV